MCRKLVCLVSLVVLLSLAGGASAELILHWSFDEGSGNAANDRSGNGRNGAIEGDPQWVAGRIGGALDFDGNGDRVVDENGGDYLNGLDAMTIAVWIKSDAIGSNAGFIIGEDPAGNDSFCTIRYDSSGASHGGTNVLKMAVTSSSEQQLESSSGAQTTEWQHIAMTWANGDIIRLYIDGVEDTPSGNDTATTGSQSGVMKLIVGQGGKDASGGWDGLIDDVRIYNTALTAEEIQAAMIGEGFPFALGPNPADGALFAETWVNLTWSAGDFAVSHDVYFSDSFDDVNNGAGDAFRGNQTADFFIVGFPGFPYPDGLVPGTTYYWRIDEVNNADPNSPWAGAIWSFSIPSKTAYEPSPGDGAKFVAADVELSWTGGFGAKLHTIYFGDDLDTVANATGGVAQAASTFAPGALEFDKTYYWRVDEFDPPFTHTGNVWSFTTLPTIPVHSDPDLVALWTFDEGYGTTALDWSGHGNNVTLIGSEWIAPSIVGDSGLKIGSYGAIQNLSYAASDLTAVTVAAWVRTSDSGDQFIVSFDRNEYYRLEINGSGGGPGQVGWDVLTSSGQVDHGSVTRVDDGVWHHIAGVYDKGQLIIYIDGIAEPSATGGATFGAGNTRFGFIGANSEATSFNGSRGGGGPVTGEVDDIRIYHRALTQEEIVLVMRGDPRLAWAPSPADGSTPDVDNVLPLSFSPGDDASSHEVYFGAEADAVKNADTSDATGIYRGSQSGTSFTPAEGVEWGAGPFYWRVDENNADGTVTKGRVWTFTVADFILVDDFESYTDNDAANQAIWQAWIDGFGVAANGSQAGYTLPPYAEQTIVHGGGQSLPLQYANTAGVMNSEVELKLTAPRDWTRNGVEELSIWFQGQPASVGSFTEGPVGTYTMTATGADIWNQADQFHFAYRTLTGVGSIEAQVLSVENTNSWAKCGVMIRETLDAGSKFAAVYIMPTNTDGSATNGVRYQARTDTDADATSDSGVATDEQKAVVAPYWVKLERDVAGNFRGYYSSNGTAWTPMAWNPQNISMGSNVLIGLALTSHDNNATCEARFSNVRTTGTVGPIWANQDIGIAANAAEPLYVAISNAAGAAAVVTHSDPAAANANAWTEWVIPLQAFADKGINLANVDKIAIGLGATGGAAAGGSGLIFIDDIGLYRTRDAAGQ